MSPLLKHTTAFQIFCVSVKYYEIQHKLTLEVIHHLIEYSFENTLLINIDKEKTPLSEINVQVQNCCGLNAISNAGPDICKH